MPFTGSHPAAVLPLLGTRLPAAALVVGSVAPDLPYYPPGRPRWQTHTAVAVVSTDLVLGLAAWLVWAAVLAAPVAAVAPRAVADRMGAPLRLRDRVSSPGRIAAVGLALVVGAATHVGWDEFTHPGRFGDRHVRWLAATHLGQPGHQWAQYASSVLGLVAVAAWSLRWLRRTPVGPAAVRRRPGRRTLTLLAASAVVVGSVAAAGAAADEDTLRRTVFTAVTSFGGGMVAVAVVAALGWHWRHPAGPPSR